MGTASKGSGACESGSAHWAERLGSRACLRRRSSAIVVENTLQSNRRMGVAESPQTPGSRGMFTPSELSVG
jgi:hypothetical protein